MGFTDNDLWVILGVLTLILVATLFGNLLDPNSNTNDLSEILGIRGESDPALERAQNELKTKLKR